jgi:hypothetical protein
LENAWRSYESLSIQQVFGGSAGAVRFRRGGFFFLGAMAL